MRIVVITLIAGIAVIPVTTAAETLTWDDCLRLARQYNPSLAAVREDLTASELSLAGSRASLRPQFSASASATQSEESGQDNGNRSYNASLRASQSIYSGGKNRADVLNAKSSLRLTEEEAARTDADLTYSLRGAFISLLAAQKERDLLERIGRRRQDNFELVKLRYDGGREHQGSLELSRAALYQAQIEATQAVRRVALSRVQLVREIGLPDDDPELTAEGGLYAQEAPPHADIRTLAEQTPSVGRALAARDSAETRVGSARSALMPDIGLSGSMSRSGDDEAFDDDRWSVGVQASVDLWSGGRNRSELARAKANLRKAEAQVAVERNAVIANLADALESYREAVETVEVQERFLRASELRAEIARKQYENGLLSFENWDIIENDLINKQKNLLNARRSAVLAEANWQRTAGEGALR